MTKYQITAKFGNAFEVVGKDEVSYAEADRLLSVYYGNRETHIHKIIGDGSREISKLEFYRQ